MPDPATGLPASQETGDTAPKGSSGTLPEDPKILPEASETPDKVNTPKEENAEISHDFTLSEEGDGDNISGNKELRKEGNDEDENNSKRAKGLPQPPAAE
jgi:hypothetical protein